MFAFNHGSGNIPVSSERWKMRLKPGAKLSAHSLRTLLWILSGPDALDTLMSRSNLATPDLMIVIFEMVLSHSTETAGIGWSDRACGVKTELNWFRRIRRAFSLLSLCRVPFSLIGATPLLSCRLLPDRTLYVNFITRYGILIKKQDIKALERVQMKATRLVTALRDKPH